MVLLSVVLALSLASTVAGAKKHKKRKGKVWASEITLVHAVPTEFTGRVTSNLGACGSQRLVTLFYTDPQTGQTQPISVQRTGGDGRYQVTLPAPAYAGTYLAQVSQQRIRARKAPQTCRFAQSASVRV